MKIQAFSNIMQTKIQSKTLANKVTQKKNLVYSNSNFELTYPPDKMLCVSFKGEQSINLGKLYSEKTIYSWFDSIDRDGNGVIDKKRPSNT